MNEIDTYFDALARLKNGKPERVPIGTKISNSSVATEAGRAATSIKKSRPVYAQLIKEIAVARAAARQQECSDMLAIESVERELAEFKRKYEAALARELALAFEIHEMNESIRAGNSSNVTPIR